MSFFDNINFSDPALWLGLGGTGFGIFSNLYGNRAQQAAYRNQVNAANQQNALIGQIMQLNIDAMNRRNAFLGDAMGQAYSLFGSPVDWRTLYQPMTDIAATAIRRGVNANSQTRGFIDSAYADAMAGEGVAKGENDRVIASMDEAAKLTQARNSALGAWLGAAGSMYGGVGYPQGFANYPTNPYKPGGSVDALGNYFNYKSMLDALNRSRGYGLGGSAPSQSLYPITTQSWPTQFSLYGDENNQWYNNSPFMQFDTP